MDMRFEVPQFIDIEDKIFGPLTWKQFAYVTGGLGALVFFYLALPFIFFVFIGIPFAVLAGALAFHKVNNRPFSYYLEAMFNYFVKGKMYIYNRGSARTVSGQSERGGSVSIASGVVEQAPKKNLQSLSRELELASLKGNQTQAEKWNENK